MGKDLERQGNLDRVSGISIAMVAPSLALAVMVTDADAREADIALQQSHPTRIYRTESPFELLSEQDRPSLRRTIDDGIDPGEAHCQELDRQLMAEGRSPVVCTDTHLRPPRSRPSHSDHGSDEQAVAPTPSDEPEPVLLIHGFSISAGHDCEEYWGEQKEEIQKEKGPDDAPLREVATVGWYEHDEGCDVDLPDLTLPNVSLLDPDPLDDPAFTQSTPMAEVAAALKSWIFHTYSINGRSVDIVAHSMGGIVTRKMLDDWGSELLVSDVVTLGTPHGGVQALHLAPFCLAIGQCTEAAADSDFMSSLAENPQASAGTRWTLIGADNDQVVGQGTGIEMGDGGGPVVDRFEYKLDHRHGCSYVHGAFSSIGHGGLHGENASLPVHDCAWTGVSTGTIANPTERIIDAID